MKEYAKIEEIKKDYEAAPLPYNVKQRVREGIAQAQKEEQEGNKTPTWGWRFAGGVAAAMLALMAFANLNTSAAQAMSNVPVLGAIVKVVTFRTYEDNNGDMNAMVKVPEVEVKDSSGEKNETASKQLNDMVDEYTNQIIKQYKADVKAVKGKGKENVLVDYHIVTDNARLFSLRIDTVIALNTSGVTAKIYHMDKETGEMLQLKDIFKSDTDYLSILTREIEKQMRKQMAEDEQKSYFLDNEIDEWKGVKKGENFYINKKGQLVIAFDKYEVAPGYMGACEFTIPQELIRDIVRTEYFE